MNVNLSWNGLDKSGIFCIAMMWSFAMEKEAVNEKRIEKLKQLNMESNHLTKECIRTALLALMGTEMFDQITVTAIIKRAGVSRGGFYRNYSSKEDVYREILEELFEYLLEFVSEYKVYENPKEWFVDYFRKIMENKEEYKLLIKAKAPTDFMVQFDVERLLHEFQKDESLLEHYRALAIVKALIEVALDWFYKGMQETPEEMAEVMYQIFFEKNKS